MAYTRITSQTLASTATTITFNSFPSTYKDLALKISARDDSGALYTSILLTVNGSITGYNSTYYARLSTAFVGVQSRDGCWGLYAGAGTAGGSSYYGMCDYYIPNYSGSQYKQISSVGASDQLSSATAGLSATANSWANTSPITSIEITSQTSPFAVGSTFYLYGIS